MARHGPAAATPVKPVLHVFPDAAALAHAAAARIAVLANETIAARGAFYIALAGGGTPKQLYLTLGAKPYRAQIDWRRVHVFFGDERAVPPDHADSNYRMAADALLSRVPLPDEQVHRIPMELPSARDAARAYRQALDRVPKADDQPCFDLILLGVGADGHIASLFPGTAAVDEDVAPVVADFVPALGTWRVTLTFPVLNAARHLMILAAGAPKAPVVRAATDAQRAKNLPVQRLSPSALEWYVDRAAAGIDSEAGRT